MHERKMQEKNLKKENVLFTLVEVCFDFVGYGRALGKDGVLFCENF